MHRLLYVMFFIFNFVGMIKLFKLNGKVSCSNRIVAPLVAPPLAHANVALV